MSYLIDLYEELWPEFAEYCSNDVIATKDLMNKQFGVSSAYPQPKKIIYDESAGVTVVLWKDGAKTVVRAAEGEKHNAYLGYCVALAKKLHGSNSALKRQIDKLTVYQGEKCNDLVLPSFIGLADGIHHFVRRFNEIK